MNLGKEQPLLVRLAFIHSLSYSRLRFFLVSLSVFVDGAGLFCGVIKHLLNRGADCPKVLAATHFHDVFRQEFLNPKATPITFLHMQVLFTTASGSLLGGGDLASFSPRPSQDESDMVTSHSIAPGEKITYLYRFAYCESTVIH